MPLLQFLCNTHVYIDICQCYKTKKQSTDVIAVTVPATVSSQKEHTNSHLYDTVTWHKLSCTVCMVLFFLCIGVKNSHITLLVLKTHCTDNCFKVDIMAANSSTWYLKVCHMSWFYVISESKSLQQRSPLHSVHAILPRCN